MLTRLKFCINLLWVVQAETEGVCEEVLQALAGVLGACVSPGIQAHLEGVAQLLALHRTDHGLVRPPGQVQLPVKLFDLGCPLSLWGRCRSLRIILNLKSTKPLK